FDRMDAVGKSVLGMTIQCAQCHTHKYDPLTQEEYYRMFAFLNNSHEAYAAVYTPAEEMHRAELLRQISEIETELQHRDPDWRERLGAWEQTVRDDQPEWTVIQNPDNDPSGAQKVYRLQDGSYLCQGFSPVKHTTELSSSSTLQNITAFR